MALSHARAERVLDARRALSSSPGRVSKDDDLLPNAKEVGNDVRAEEARAACHQDPVLRHG